MLTATPCRRYFDLLRFAGIKALRDLSDAEAQRWCITQLLSLCDRSPWAWSMVAERLPVGQACEPRPHPHEIDVLETGRPAMADRAVVPKTTSRAMTVVTSQVTSSSLLVSRETLSWLGRSWTTLTSP